MIHLFTILINVLSYAKVYFVKKPDRTSAEYLLGQRIADLRESENLTQEQFAEQTGLSRAYIGRIELGIVSPSFRTLMKIAAGLGFKGISYLFVNEAGERNEFRQ